MLTSKNKGKPGRACQICLLSFMGIILLLVGLSAIPLSHRVEYYPIDPTALVSKSFDQSFYDVLGESLVNMYTSEDRQLQREYIDKLYLKNATFDDNLVIVHNSDGIKYQFGAVLKFFHKVDMTLKSVYEERNTNDDPVIHIESSQTFWFNPDDEPTVLETDSWLTVDKKSGLITYHMERWQDQYLAPTWIRRPFGAVSTLFFRVIGC